MTERWVVCGLAPARSEWFGRVARWSTAGTVPVEFVKCLSVEELRARLDGNRPISAVLVDARMPGVDRDVLHGGPFRRPVVVVTGGGAGAGRDWTTLGAAAVLDEPFEPPSLLDALAAVSAPVGEPVDVPGDPVAGPPLAAGSGVLVAVCGSGGTGTSTIAAALAQGVCRGRRRRTGRRRLGPPALLADLALRADQAMLHDVADPLVTIQELVDAHRSDTPPPEHVRAHCVAVPARGYELLLGLRRPRAWTALRPRSVAAAVEGLLAAYPAVVADTDADLEGEVETGSLDVEERNCLARTVVRRASCVLAVGGPGMKGTSSLVRLVHGLAAAGVAPARVVPVVNRAPRSTARRSEMTAALADLCDLPEGRPHPPIFLPERRVDEAFRDGAPLPSPLPDLLPPVVEEVLRRAPPPTAHDQLAGGRPTLVRPGSLGLAGGGWTSPGHDGDASEAGW